MSNDPVRISYSSSSRYKGCPEKFFLSKRYKTKLIPSSLPFGKAIEEGVSALLKGATIEQAREIFESHWTIEKEGSGTRAIYDNLDVEFYASDYDANLLLEEDYPIIDNWVRTCQLQTDIHWSEVFDYCATAVKSNSYNENQLKFYNLVVWRCCLIRGFVMLEAFTDKLLPKIKVHKIDGKDAIQKEISIANDEGDKITGFIDFIIEHEDYDRPIITDLKTAAYPYVAHALDTSEQLRTYVAAVGGEINSALAGYIVLLKKIKVDRMCDACGAKREGLAKNCKACGKGKYTKAVLYGDLQFIIKDYGEEELEDLMEDYTNVMLAVKHEVRFKNPANCNNYNRECEFYQICWSKKKASELPHIEERPEKVVEPTDEKAPV